MAITFGMHVGQQNITIEELRRLWTLADNNGLAASGDYVAIPGDLTHDLYSFTFVPREMLT